MLRVTAPEPPAPEASAADDDAQQDERDKTKDKPGDKPMDRIKDRVRSKDKGDARSKEKDADDATEGES